MERISDELLALPGNTSIPIISIAYSFTKSTKGESCKVPYIQIYKLLIRIISGRLDIEISYIV